jgi:hypothetical protein
VYSASRLISWGVGPLGAGLAALVAELWGIRVMFAIGAVISTGLLVLFLKYYHSSSFTGIEKATGPD